MNDAVNKPNHYQLFADGTEAIDVIRRTLSPEEFVGYCKGNVLKYRLRAGKKDALEQDIAKAEAYNDMLSDYLKDHPYLSMTVPSHVNPRLSMTGDEAILNGLHSQNASEILNGIRLLNASCHKQRVKCGDDRRSWGCLDCLASDCESA